MIQLRLRPLLAARPRSAALTGLVLAAALVRELAGGNDALSANVLFALILGLVLVLEPPGVIAGIRPLGLAPSIGLGLLAGALLAIPVMFSGVFSARPMAAFGPWATATLMVAALEEAAIRGAVQQLWTEERGVVAGLAAGAITFAAIHIPHYGLAAMPIDLAVGVLLGGLRLVTGRILPCVIAHTLADWGAWFQP
jgi:membrane protease YdiL (CAAX protease family)